MRAPVGEGRERLLQSLFDEFGENGPSPNLSMRQVAERLGVHHTLLTYHFGSRPGLLQAVLTQARRRDNLAITAAAAGLGFGDLYRFIWTFYSGPERQERIRAFFHIVGLVAYEQDTFHEFVADLGDLAALLEQAARRDGAAAADAELKATLAASCLRGLLLQKVLTPAADVDAAAELFIASLSTLDRSAS